MRIVCPVTALAYILPGFDTAKIASPHPFLLQSLQRLAQLSGQTSLSEEENKLLFLALLYRTHSVAFNGPVPLQRLSLNQCIYNIPFLLSFCYWAENHPRKDHPNWPTFSLSLDSLPSLQTYINILRDFKEFGAHITADSALSPEELEERKQIMMSVRTRKAQKRDQFRMIVLWAMDYMLTNCPGFTELNYRIMKAVLYEKKSYTLDSMRKLRYMLLDYLPTNTSEYQIRTSVLIEQLDVQILEQVEFLRAMDTLTGEETEEIAKEIGHNYTIAIEEEEGEAMTGPRFYSNSAARPVQRIDAMRANSAPTLAAPAAPATKPVESEYKNKLAYLAALNLWQLAQAQ